MTPAESAFLRAILAGSPAAVLMYADWLREQGREDECPLWELGPWPRTEAYRAWLRSRGCSWRQARDVGLCGRREDAQLGIDRRSEITSRDWHRSIGLPARVFRVTRRGVAGYALEVAGAFRCFDRPEGDDPNGWV